MAARYAIYYAPPRDSALAAFARAWLGRDAETGDPVPQPGVPGLTLDRLWTLTADPRRYGFHGTLKPPFVLADGTTPAMLRDEIAAFAANRRSFAVPRLALRRIGRFIALTPEPCLAELGGLAADCVRAFDRFRRPPDADELGRRRAAGLSDRQEALLQRWGYPYVMEEFSFHLTLTGSVAEDGERALLLQALDGVTESVRATPVPVAEIVLFVQADGESDFRIAERFHFGG